ncbi:MAG: hypothetical protein WEE64_02540 [Dehalococcoidia bacterium]
MASKDNRSDASRSVRGGASDALARVLFRLSTQLFGGRMTPPDGPDWRLGGEQPPAKQAHPAAEAARILERALAEAETMLGRLERGLRSAPPAPQPQKDETMASQELSELQRNLQALTGRLEEALARLAKEIERLAAGTVHLSQLVERLESQPVAPAAPAPALDEAVPSPAALVAVPAAQEPRFQPGEQALGVVIGAVPGFQGLMDVQRGLSGLPAVAGAPVRRYKNGEALLEVALREPVSVTQIVQKLETTTGRTMLIEEAHPESLRLRLRFVDGEGRAPDGAPDPELPDSLRRDD